MSERDLDFHLEDRLKRELQRVDAPTGFADRVMDRVGAQLKESRKQQLIVMPRRFAWMALAAMLLVGIVLGGWQWRQQQRRERLEAEVARRQFEVAMQVTGRTLVGVQERIGRAGRKREVE